MILRRAVRFTAAFLAVVCACAAAANAAVHFTAFDTHSGIRIVRFGTGFEWTNRTTEPATFSCVSFVNTDPRDVTAITFHFAAYDFAGNLAGDNYLERKGRFRQGVQIEAINSKTHQFDRADCLLNPTIHDGLARVFVFVTAVTFADGTQWSTSGPAVPKVLGVDDAPAPSASP